MPRGFGKARSCIVVFAWGGLSHIDTFDLKPEAGSGIKSAFDSIPTTIPGYHVCEHLPRLARQVHRMTLIRSMHHDAPSHRSAAYWNLTGHAPPKLDKNWPRTRKDWPSIGSMVAHARHDPIRKLPGNVALPYPIYDGDWANGQHAGFLGMPYDPVIMKPDEGTPYDGKSPVSGHLSFDLIEGLDEERLVARRSLLADLSGNAQPTEPLEHYQQRVFDMLLDAETRKAFKIDDEPERQHQRYGAHILGQSLLTARRLTGAGVPLVTVYAAAGDLNGSKGAHFDTHSDGYNRLKKQMLPPLDQGLSALLDDLHESGRIEETLVVLLTEFGRTPKVNGSGGRDHYPKVYTVALAGAGVSKGLLYGTSDASGAFPASGAATPADLHASIFHALGIAPNRMIHDLSDRPLPMCDGSVLPIFS
ncbi:MAG: DUF1501 domain-containing protein [Roseibacillus sp.]|nr:DUF1501 domain-containing protein [Roseibacillus sp.]